jgi:hypothetical protein
VGIYKDRTKDLHRASSNSSLVSNDLVMCQLGHNDMTINQSSDSLVTKKPFPECEEDILEIVAKEVP